MLDDQSVRFVSPASDLACFDFDWLGDVLVVPRGRDLSVLFLGGVLEAESEGDVGEVLVGVGHAQRMSALRTPVEKYFLHCRLFFRW